MDFQNFLNKNLQDIKAKGLYRQLKTLGGRPGAYVDYQGRRVLQVSSNNYLGLAGDKRLEEAVIKAVQEYGVGSTGSRLISGTHELHVKLEEEIASLKGTEAAIVFSCGYAANVGALSGLLSQEDAVYSDELNHASIIDGIRLSRANKFIYKHNDTADLERLLEENSSKYRLNVIVTDSIFSMDGDRADLREIARIKEKFGAVLFVDEAHAFGVYSSSGEGLAHELGIDDKVDIQMGTLSKAAGSEGGYIAGSAELIDYLRNKSRSFIYSTAPTVPAIAASLEAVRIIKEADDLRQKLYENIDYLKNRLLEKDFKLIAGRNARTTSSADSAIFCIEFDDIEQTCRISQELLEKHNILAGAIRPPTAKTPRIRICTMSLHSKKDLDYLLESLSV